MIFCLPPNECAHGMLPLVCPKCNPPPSWPQPDPTNAEVAALRAERDALAARLAEAVGVVREVKERNAGCPWCGGFVGGVPSRCMDDCALARVLAAGEGKTNG